MANPAFPATRRMSAASPTPRQQLLIGLVAAIAGLSIVALATGIVAAPEQSFRAPHWVVGMAGLLFVLIGALFLTPLVIAGFVPADRYTAAQSRAIKLVQQILGCLLLTSFAAVPLWIGFGPGERAFSTSLGIPGFASHGAGNEMIGRIVFGAAGVLMALWAAATWIGLLKALFQALKSAKDA